MAICSEEGRRSSFLGLKDAGTPRSSTLSGSVWRAGGAGGVSLLSVGEGAWVARFLAVWLFGLDPQRFGLASWRGRWRFALVGWGRCLVARFLMVWLLDILDPSIGGRPERTLGSESDFLERWSAWSPISR